MVTMFEIFHSLMSACVQRIMKSALKMQTLTSLTPLINKVRPISWLCFLQTLKAVCHYSVHWCSPQPLNSIKPHCAAGIHNPRGYLEVIVVTRVIIGSLPYGGKRHNKIARDRILTSSAAILLSTEHRFLP